LNEFEFDEQRAVDDAKAIVDFGNYVTKVRTCPRSASWNMLNDLLFSSCI